MIRILVYVFAFLALFAVQTSLSFAPFWIAVSLTCKCNSVRADAATGLASRRKQSDNDNHD
ncbi:hypothetical protein BCR44DRAFT_36384, partial [Catenaria anguillulae PL171]